MSQATKSVLRAGVNLQVVFDTITGSGQCHTSY